MSPRTLRTISTLPSTFSQSISHASLPVLARNALAVSIAALTLSGCAAQNYTPAEQEMVDTLKGTNFQPATREVRENIETQGVLAQAAFWSREHSLNPGDLEASIKLASAVRRMGNPSQAIEITQQARALYPRDPYLAAEYAAALIASERGVDAIDTLDAALRNASGYARLWSLKGAALDQMEQYDLARKHYARALQITPYDPSILANIGLSYALSGDAATGENWLRRAAAIPGAGASVRQNLAIVLQLQGKTQEADTLLPPQRSVELAAPNLTPPAAQGYAPQQSAPSTPLRQTQPYGRAQPSNTQGGYPSQNTQSKVYGNLSGGQPSAPRNNYAPQRSSAPSYPTQSAPSQTYSGQSSPSQTYSGQASQKSQAYAPQSYRQAAQQQAGTQYYGPTPQGSAPVTSASDAARAAARNIQQRNLNGRYVEPVSSPTPEQISILDRLAQNVGPRAATTTGQQSGYPTNTQYGTQGYSNQGYGSQGYTGQEGYNTQAYNGQNTSASQYGTQQYSGQVVYEDPQNTPRGAARRR